MKYRRKPVEIDVDEYSPGMEDGFSCIPLATECIWRNEHGDYKDCSLCKEDIAKLPYIASLDSNMYIFEGDWIITNEKCEQYPCKPDVVKMKYEPINIITGSLFEAHVRDEYCNGCGKLKVLCTHSTTGCV